MKHFFRIFASGILAGVMISLGGLAFVASVSFETTGLGRILGSFLFATGLMGVCFLSLFLYTGKIGYVFQNKTSFLWDLLIGYLGNLAGSLFMGFIVSLIPLFNDGTIGKSFDGIAIGRDVLTGESWWSALLLSFVCGILVFVAVEVFKKKGGVMGTIGLIFAVAAFVVTGTEHTIANMFYFSAAGYWSLGAFLNVLVTTVGNSLGAIFFERLLALASPSAPKESLAEKR